ncbi:ABC transporter permease [Klebsiella pneumoniae]|uniref:ABC transporter permease n=1 Tax=Klebsiella pneumoniae TaxID=573 RepID=UPI0012326E0C|nr:ABC transporter permease [Klebsiella pneumoniae]KAA5894542.1 ABC transporter permease [Klebsiella pneumoniae]
MFHRLWTLIRKELQSLLREPQTRAILIMPVLIQVLLFPFAATLEVTNATIAIYNEDSGRHAVELTQRFARAKAFTHVLLLQSPQAIQPTIDEQKALLVVRNWYNPNLDYKWFVVPSLIAMITTIGVMIVTSLSVAREREQGTLDQLLVSPLATWQIFVGKAVPALIVATLQATIVLAIGIWAYQIPFAGSLLLFYFTMVIYGLSLVGFGLLISSLCATQQQAFIGVFVFMMPAILLSGYVSPVENMPQWLQNLTWINPIRHFTDITKQIYLKDASLEIVWGSLWPLLVIAATTGSAAYAMFRRKIA